MSEFPSRGSVSTLIRPEEALPLLPKWYELWAYRLQERGRRWLGSRGLWRGASARPDRALRRCLIHVAALDVELSDLSDKGLAARLSTLRSSLLRKGYSASSLAEAFGIIREMSGRVLGMKHFDSQLSGGWHLMHGRIAEMATGEGKTLTATLPAAAAALAGIPVHVITVNDYLAARDCEEMKPLYQALGLTVGCIQPGMSPDERRAIYASDVVYCTNSELVFDYLKDHLLIKNAPQAMHRYAERLKGNQELDKELMLRGLHFAIVDEADSVCMDEARTPLIISATKQASDAETEIYRQALAVARQLTEQTHFTRYDRLKQVELSDAGETRVDALVQHLGAYWVGRVRRYELVRQALSADLYFIRDRHYLVRDNKVQIIDEHTGRVMADRSWERGLHQLLEIKEGCEVTAGRETLAKISYQRFFRRYRAFSGMTGTAREVRDEFWDIYRKQVFGVSTHHSLRRLRYRSGVYVTRERQLEAIAKAARRERDAGRAVLIGTTTVTSSEEVAQALESAGLDTQLLNAKQDREEAGIIAQAGQPGRITIATSMAGRGTDIKLHPEVEQNGGLHVILCALQDAGRIDRQLEGRCARFGDPGSVEWLLSLGDDWLKEAWYRPWLARQLSHQWGKVLAIWLMRRAQTRLERRHRRIRYQLMKVDEQQGELMAFTQGSL